MTTLVGVIQQTVADYCGLPVELMLSRKRRREIAWPRQLAIAMSVELIQGARNGSFPYVAKQFGLDHTTAMHACKVVEAAEIAGERPWSRELSEIRRACVRAVEAWRAAEEAQLAEWARQYPTRLRADLRRQLAQQEAAHEVA